MLTVLGSATAFTAHRANELIDENRQLEAAARQEFVTGLDSAKQHVGSEVDRLTELAMAVRAHVAANPEDPRFAVEEYLAGSGASERFSGLTSGQVVVLAAANVEPDLLPYRQQDPDDTDTGTVSITLDFPETEQPGDPASANAPDAAESDREVDGIEELDVTVEVTESQRVDALDAIDPSRRDGGPFLTISDIDGRQMISLTFAITERFNGGERIAWAALQFDESAFLARAIAPQSRITSELFLVGQIDGETAPISDELVERTADRRLTADVGVDVLGTRFLLRTTSTANFLPRVPTNSLAVIMGFAGVAAAILYLALRSQIRAKTAALETARTETAARKAIDRRFRTSFESAPIGMAELDHRGLLVEVNEAMGRQLGADRELLLGRPLSKMVHESERDAHIERIEALLKGGHPAVQSEHRYQHTDGRTVWVSESISVIDPENTSSERALLVQSQDITAQRRAAWELAQQALHDDLTNLPNRALFLNRLKHALQRAERNNQRVAVMFIDVDRFKVINDSLGHEMGDAFLVDIAGRIGRAIRVDDTVARFGGDEFVVLCETVENESEALAVAQRIQSSFGEPFMLGTTPTYASASIGITISDDGDHTADSMLRDADAAMYRAKDTGRNRTEVFNHSMRTSVVARMEIESQLRDALKNGEIVMHYQAIVDPRTHQPTGYEALIRWNHPEKGLLGPGAFLPVAEEAGLIHLIDSFALRSTCNQIADWVKRFPAARNLYLTTNWSARHMGRFVQQVEQVLAETRISPSQLVIEVTEGFLLEDSDASIVALEELKRLGVHIAIDDFGTGYSSLSYLTQFAVDYLKIDQSFVAKLPDDAASAAVIGAIADMANRLGIQLVAEGVETDAQIEMLQSLGSPRMQGYRFAKPRPAADIEEHLAHRSQEVQELGPIAVGAIGSY